MTDKEPKLVGRLNKNEKTPFPFTADNSERVRERRDMISRLDAASLDRLLWEYRSKYYSEEQGQSSPPKFDHRVDFVLQTYLPEKYKDISAEERQRFSEFVKNFVYAGDQFLYAKVAST